MNSGNSRVRARPPADWRTAFHSAWTPTRLFSQWPAPVAGLPLSPASPERRHAGIASSLVFTPTVSVFVTATVRK